MMSKDVLWDIIPNEEKRKVLSQEYCELDESFMGFTDIYKHLSAIIPKHFTVVDLGCYLAAQCYFFKDHKKYIGVDEVTMKRFALPNVAHYVCTIQEYIGKHMDNLDLETTFAICSYVPDYEAQTIVRRYFENVYVYYPAGDFAALKEAREAKC